MTDNEIIEQLIQFLETGHFTRKWSDREYAIIILSLIQRQKEKIEELEKGELSKAMTFNSNTIKRCSAEAIKEFAERLKKKTYPFPCAIGVENAVTVRVINDLVKEITEGENG